MFFFRYLDNAHKIDESDVIEKNVGYMRSGTVFEVGAT